MPSETLRALGFFCKYFLNTIFIFAFLAIRVEDSERRIISCRGRYISTGKEDEAFQGRKKQAVTE